MTVKVTAELNCSGDDTQQLHSAIHSIVWEDLEPMEGQEHSKLVTADKSRMQVWDLDRMQVDTTFQVADLARSDGTVTSGGPGDLVECTVVKRDPHDPKLIALGIEDQV